MQDMQRHPRLRVATLTAGSAVVAARGAAYINAPQTGLTTFVDALVPLHVWAVVWVAVAAAILCGIWSRPLARVAMSCMLGVAVFMWILARLIEVLHEPETPGAGT